MGEVMKSAAHKQELKAKRARKAALAFELRLVWLLARRDNYSRTVQEYLNNAWRWIACGDIPRTYKREMKKCPKLKLVS